MTEREKVIKGLGIHADRSDKTDCDDCPYSKDDFSKGNCISQLCSDALALLKEQQTPHWVFGNSYGHAWMKCSNCCVSQSGQTSCWSYCPNCGAKMEGQVRWDG